MMVQVCHLRECVEESVLCAVCFPLVLGGLVMKQIFLRTQNESEMFPLV